MKTKTNALAAAPTNLTRKGFLGLIGGALATPTLVIAKARPVVKDVVRQAELQAVIDMENQAEALAASLRMRLEGGAGFERGRLGVNAIGNEDQFGEYSTFMGGGLEIGPAEEFVHYLDLQKKYPHLGLVRA